jgi:AcrR family transcriptional regulator
MRAVATRARVDVALIYHHFGGKAGLLEATLAVPAKRTDQPASHSSWQSRPGQGQPSRAVDPTVLISAVAPTIEQYLAGDLTGRVDPIANSKRRSRKPSR